MQRTRAGHAARRPPRSIGDVRRYPQRGVRGAGRARQRRDERCRPTTSSERRGRSDGQHRDVLRGVFRCSVGVSRGCAECDETLLYEYTACALLREGANEVRKKDDLNCQPVNTVTGSSIAYSMSNRHLERSLHSQPAGRKVAICGGKSRPQSRLASEPDQSRKQSLYRGQCSMHAHTHKQECME